MIKEIEKMIEELKTKRENIKNSKHNLKDDEYKEFLQGVYTGTIIEINEEIQFLKKLIAMLKGE